MKKYFPFEIVESIEVIEILKVDLKKGYKILLSEIVFNPGYSIKDLEKLESVTILSVIKEEENSCVCLLKGQPPAKYLNKFNHLKNAFNVDAIWDTPARITENLITFSAISEEKTLNKILTAINIMGTVEKLSFSKKFMEGLDILSNLTEKQKKTIFAAKKYGYYEYPRKITSEILSKRIGISKATTVEHLRKAENRIIQSILPGL